MKRGQVWWANLPDPTILEPGYRRPVLIVQSDTFNISRISTIIVAALTTNLRLAGMPGNVTVLSDRSGLPKDSVVNVSQLLTVNRSNLVELIGQLDGSAMHQVERGLCKVLGLSPAV